MKMSVRVLTLVITLLGASVGLAARPNWDEDSDTAPTPDLLLASDEEPQEGGSPTLAEDGHPRPALWSMEDYCNDCCDDFLCEPCCQCGPPGRFWLRSEYVGWWNTPGRVPTLVTTTTGSELPATQVLYGNATYNGGYRSGNWTQGGVWADCGRTCGVMGDYFFVGRDSSPFDANSGGFPVLARPFIDANTGEASQQLVAYPDRVVGEIHVQNYNSLMGTGGAFRRNLCCTSNCCDDCCDDCCDWMCAAPCWRVDLIAGFRYYRFNDNIGISERLVSTDLTSGVPVGTQINVNDSFRTLNSFYGGEFGLMFDRYRGRWLFEAAAKVALGSTQQIVAINGDTNVSFGGQSASGTGGILALSSNIGRHKHSSFSAIPQVSTRLGWRATERLTLLVGYTCIYWDQLARAGEQIDTTVNPNLFPGATGGGPNRPAFHLNLSDLFLQGITIGGEVYF